MIDALMHKEQENSNDDNALDSSETTTAAANGKKCHSLGLSLLLFRLLRAFLCLLIFSDDAIERRLATMSRQ